MSIQRIFVPLQKDDILVPRLNYALVLAKRLDASIEVGFIHGGSDPETIEVNFTGGDVAKGFALNAEAGDQAGVDAARRGLSEWITALGISSDEKHSNIMMREYWNGVDDVITKVGRLSDLILTGPCKSGSSIFSDPVSRVSLLASARLILGVGDVQVEPTHLLDRVVIAWDGSAGATRTLAQALPILSIANKVNIVFIDSSPISGPSASDLVDYLNVHRIQAHADFHPKDSYTTGGALLKYLSQEGATLLIMGTYDHNRTGEIFFGGTTVEVLERITIPVLMSY